MINLISMKTLSFQLNSRSLINMSLLRPCRMRDSGAVSEHGLSPQGAEHGLSPQGEKSIIAASPKRIRHLAKQVGGKYVDLGQLSDDE